MIFDMNTSSRAWQSAGQPSRVSAGFRTLRKILLSLTALFAVGGTVSAQNAAPSSVPPATAPAMDPVLLRVNEAVRVTKLRNLDFQRHTPWQILHGLLALREHYTVKNGDQFVNALDYLSTEARYKGEGWFQVTPWGAKAHPYNGTPYDFEGHVNQTLSIISMCNVPLTHEFKTADGRTVTMADMVRHAQMAVSSKEELTWTLWYLTHYLDQDTVWTNAAGERWSMEALVRNQNSASVLTAPCGGCHNLFALAYARNSYLQKHGKLQGAWLEADNKIQQYISTAQVMQNRDGSFATQYFKSRGFSTDFNERIKSSGHMLEWLMVALPKSRLNENWVRLGVQTLANDMIQNAAQPADCGPLYHSLNALVLYQQRMGVSQNGGPVEQSVAKPNTSNVDTGNAANAVSANLPANTIVPPVQQPMPPAESAANAPQSPVTQNAPAEKPADNAEPEETGKQPLTKATPMMAPQLVTPPHSKSQTKTDAPPRILPRGGDRVAEQMRSLRRLSGDGETAEVVPAPATKETIDPAKLTPVVGGMPIFKPTAAGATSFVKQETPVPDETKESAQPEDEATAPESATTGGTEQPESEKETTPAPTSSTESAAENGSESKDTPAEPSKK